MNLIPLFWIFFTLNKHHTKTWVENGKNNAVCSGVISVSLSVLPLGSYLRRFFHIQSKCLQLMSVKLSCMPLYLWCSKQVELAREENNLELFQNETHPQFQLIKARILNYAVIILFANSSLLIYPFFLGFLFAFCTQKEVMKSRNKELVGLFDNGIGIHHAGMLRADRALTERLFSDGLLKVRNFCLLFLPCIYLCLHGCLTDI